ncbi:MAG TPA: hypothetical protein VJN18_11095 [Polyangiaceae bacterium]|nr:hypothetical protein [Polyangiaceae bacterium]
MAPFDPIRLAALLRGGAELLESREARLAFKARFGEATTRTVFQLLEKRGVNPELLELIRRDLGL